MVRRVSPEIVQPIARLERHGDAGITDTLPGQADRFGSNSTLNTIDRHLKPQTFCWCERTIVTSTWQRIYDGVGETCGHPNCHPKENP